MTCLDAISTVAVAVADAGVAAFVTIFPTAAIVHARSVLATLCIAIIGTTAIANIYMTMIFMITLLLRNFNATIGKAVLDM